jgi:tetratricopeptide (TPR) repeat protein
VFALQDKVTAEIVMAMTAAIGAPDGAEPSSGQSTPAASALELPSEAPVKTGSPAAYDAYLRGWQLYRRYTPEDFFAAIPHLERAVELDPDFGRAWATLASVYWTAYRNGLAWSDIVNPNKSQQTSWVGWVSARDKAERYLFKAKRNPSPLAHQIESLIWSDFRQFDKGIAEAKKAVALDPNDPQGHVAMAWALIFAGQAETAVPFAETAIRLDPHFPANYRFALGTAQLMLKKYAVAENILKSAFDLNPQEIKILAPLAVAYAQLGKNEEARTTRQKYIDFWSNWEQRFEARLSFWPFKREADIRLFGGGLVKAGLCCEDQLETYIDKLRRGGTLE